MFDRILLAIDDSVSSKRATTAAANLAKIAGSEVIVYHGREREVVVGGRSGGVYDLETPSEALKLVDEAVATLKDAGVSARGEARNAMIGRVAREIVEAAKAEDAELIVMGTRGISDWEGLFVGSVAHRVLHIADVPVMVVR